MNRASPKSPLRIEDQFLKFANRNTTIQKGRQGMELCGSGAFFHSIVPSVLIAFPKDTVPFRCQIIILRNSPHFLISTAPWSLQQLHDPARILSGAFL